jgi:hypothetical protein
MTAHLQTTQRTRSKAGTVRQGERARIVEWGDSQDPARLGCVGWAAQKAGSALCAGASQGGSIPAGAHRLVCAPLDARAPRSLCSSSSSRALGSRATCCEDHLEKDPWPGQGKRARAITCERAKKDRDAAMRRQADTKRTPRRGGTHDGADESRAQVELCERKCSSAQDTHSKKLGGAESTSSLRDSSLSPVHQLRLPVPVPNQS